MADCRLRCCDDSRLVVRRSLQRPRHTLRSRRNHWRMRFHGQCPPPCHLLSSMYRMKYIPYYYYLTSPLATLRLSDRRLLGCICLHSASAWLALLKCTHHCRRWSGHCSQHLIWCSWPNHRCLDLYCRRSGKGISNWSLGQCWDVVLCCSWVCGPCALLQNAEPEDFKERGY